jgi:hypothetical protein
MCVAARLDHVALFDLLVEERIEAVPASPKRVDLSHGREYRNESGRISLIAWASLCLPRRSVVGATRARTVSNVSRSEAVDVEGRCALHAAAKAAHEVLVDTDLAYFPLQDGPKLLMMKLSGGRASGAAVRRAARATRSEGRALLTRRCATFVELAHRLAHEKENACKSRLL